jgi:hypothetical protein
MQTPKFTNEILEAAITGFEQQKAQIDAKIADLRAMMTGGTTANVPAPTPETAKPARKQMSVAARKKIGEAVRKAALAKKATAVQAPPAKRTNRKLSVDGRRRIIEANNRMWAARRGEAAKAKTAVVKKSPAKKS